jgi:general secretion pathway protein A
MYARFFGLNENPFGLPPDPRYLYMSRRHQEALAHLTYGVTQGGGFVVLSGEVGTGKTLMIRALLEQLPQNVDVALVLYPMLSVREFVASICDDLRVPYPRKSDSLKVLIDALNAYLLENHAKGRRTVLVIDEAHKLSHDVLEQVRLLTNLETSKEKLLQILLVGQPELDALLAQPHLRQLAQRVTARYELRHLSATETREYVSHRLRVAGGESSIFTNGALRVLHRLSGGVPRLVNVIADRALLGAYAHNRHRIGAWMVQRAAREVGRFAAAPSPARRAAAVTLLALTFTAFGAWQFAPAIMDRFSSQNPAPAPTAGNNAVAAPAPALAELLADARVQTDTDAAFRALFSRWQLDYAQLPGATGCARAEQAGLRCLATAGTWTSLRNHDRPAILELVDSQGNRRHVLLAALDDEHATLAFGDRSQRYPLAEIERHWFGKYLMLWRAPLAETDALRVGARGPAVSWVRETLARAQGAPPPAAPMDEFDTTLDEAVRDFQRRHRLPADGVVGTLTWLQLSSYDTRTDAPRLRTGGVN